MSRRLTALVLLLSPIAQLAAVGLLGEHSAERCQNHICFCAPRRAAAPTSEDCHHKAAAKAPLTQVRAGCNHDQPSTLVPAPTQGILPAAPALLARAPSAPASAVEDPVLRSGFGRIDSPPPKG